MAGAFFAFGAKDAGLAGAVRDAKGRFVSGNQAMKDANERSVQYLKDAAAGILEHRVKRDKDFRNRRGLGVVSDDSVHEANIDKFSFWIHDRVAAADARVATYYRAVDQGSDYWVERTAGGQDFVALLFAGRPSWPTRDIRTQAAFADRRGARVIITKPVPAYEFLTQPVREFQQQGLYVQFVRAEFGRRGLKAKLSR